MILEQLTGYTQERQKEIILTELYNSGQLQQKIFWALNRYRIPVETGINEDITQEVFFWLAKYPTQELLQMFYDNPNRVLALGVTLISKKGFQHDKRSQYGYKSSPAAHIMHLSNLGAYTLANIDDKTGHTVTSNYSLNPFTPETEDYDINEIPDIPVDDENIEEQDKEMWEYVRQNLTPIEEETLDYALVLPPSKMRKQLKKDYFKLLPRLKTLITEFKNNY